MLLSSSNHGQNFAFGFHFHTSVDFATGVKKKRQTYAIPFLSQKLLETIALRHAQTKIIINWIKDPVTSLLKFMLQAILSVEKETELKQRQKACEALTPFLNILQDGNLKIIDAELKVDQCSLGIIQKYCLASC